MSVYVDKLRKRKNLTVTWPYYWYCRLTADTRLELMEMAVRLRLHWEWLHETKKMSYFVLNRRRREWAVEFGAIETDDRRRKQD